ncbi:hypothetical protein GALMADRAFT_211581 [Galerina marginata CBS 339.88]|uniref:Uncharacterized protein n=1 Tax=Galerina marginata (strain CBS 339.88) TaxID=685588 RepID=A0A067T613_GALM3|nr:hypothetical protein GALMADRAFT_211581 [Galerina marginata CBS 339.88]
MHDTDIEQINGQVIERTQRLKIKSYRCVLYGALASRPHVVTIPLDPGIEIGSHPDDLALETWMQTYSSTSPNIVNLSENRSTVGIPLLTRYIVQTLKVDKTKPELHIQMQDNQLIANLNKVSGCQWWGAVIVVKHGPRGIRNISEDELFTINSITKSVTSVSEYNSVKDE